MKDEQQHPIMNGMKRKRISLLTLLDGIAIDF